MSRAVSHRSPAAEMAPATAFGMAAEAVPMAAIAMRRRPAAAAPEIARGTATAATRDIGRGWSCRTALGLTMLALTACSAGPLGGSGSGGDVVGPSGMASEGPTDLATQQACRQRVNEMFEIRDRGDVYAANPTTNTPYSANSSVGVPSHGLSNQFAYDQTVAECERNARNGTGPELIPPPVPSPSGPTGR